MKSAIRTSSFNNEFYEELFYNLVRDMKPDFVVELGTLAGHSAYCFASALKDNGKGSMECWDLWEKYPYNKASLSEAAENLKGLPVVLRQNDAFEAYKNYEDESVDILMVDVSNDGNTYRRILNDWYPLIKKGGKILMEGGSKERDEILWMKKYDKPPIYPVIHENNSWIKERYSVEEFELFPSLTIFSK
jgi:predicted O-methyltransferase YrrM